ncbi:hypothetical protein [Bradyrhizobium sp. USDA 336]|uniref:hypothetical protein n=1 Tax=Bradyrhizobium sp. USDA 336 TaxID=3156311 RepID=UPI0038367FF9
MMTTPNLLSREDVLDAFAVEPNHGRATLERYIVEFPQFAAELVDLSRELSRSIAEDDAPLSSQEEALINRAWTRHVEAAPRALVDPLANLSVDELRDVAQRLDVPRQVVTAFRERRVDLNSVPSGFWALFAAAVRTTVDVLKQSLALPAQPTFARSYRADDKPAVELNLSFERILIDAGVSEEKRAKLMAGDG